MVVARRTPRIWIADAPGVRRYFVKGSEPQPYLVDLDEYEGNGWCDCTDFGVRKRPHLEQGEHNVRKYRCKHMKFAIGFEKAVASLKALQEKADQEAIAQAGSGTENILQAEEPVFAFESILCGVLDSETAQGQASQADYQPVEECAPQTWSSWEDAQ